MREPKSSGPKSRFVRNILKGLPFSEENFAYVTRLLRIEGIVLSGIRSIGTGIEFDGLVERHPAEADAIYRELNPKDYPAFARERQRIERDAREPQPPRASKARWKKWGGRV